MHGNPDRTLSTVARRAVLCAGAALALALACPAFAGADAVGGERAPYTTPVAVLDLAPASLTEAELDTVVGTFTYRGEEYPITARAAIEDTVALASVANPDGTYAAPSADMIMTCARNRILAMLVEQEGVSVSEEEVAAYAQQAVGTSDIAVIAQYYGMGEEQAAGILAQAAAVVKLRDAVVGPVDPAPQAPVAPAAGSDGAAQTPEYAAYVLDLVGDAWDGAAGTWADEGGVFAQALASQGFDGKQASYEAAQIAYYVAYSLYQQQAAEQRAAWTDYVNQYLGEAGITIATLRS